MYKIFAVAVALMATTTNAVKLEDKSEWNGVRVPEALAQEDAFGLEDRYRKRKSPQEVFKAMDQNHNG